MPPAFPFPQPQAPAKAETPEDRIANSPEPHRQIVREFLAAVDAMHPMVCAWCHQQIRAGNPDLPVSHGICTSCRNRWVDEGLKAGLVVGEVTK